MNLIFQNYINLIFQNYKIFIGYHYEYQYDLLGDTMNLNIFLFIINKIFFGVNQPMYCSASILEEMSATTDVFW